VIRSLCYLSLVAALLCVSAAAQDVIAEAKKELDAKNYDRVIELLEDKYDDIKDDQKAIELLADATLKAGKYDRCIFYANRLADMAPEYPEGHKYGAQAFYWRAEEAKTDPGATPGKINGLYEEARGFARQYLKLKPDDAEMWWFCGHTLYWLEEHDESAAAFGQAFKLDPNNTKYLTDQSRAHRLAGKFDEAAAVMDKAIAANPDNATLIKDKAEVLLFKANASKKDEDSRAAGKVYGDALAAKTLSGEIAATCTNALWAIYGKNKDYDEALGYITAWAAAHPKDPSPYWWAGWYQRQKGAEQEALAAYTRCWDVSGQKWASAAADIGEQHRRMAYSKPDGDGQARIEDVKQLETAVDWLCKAQQIPWNWGGAAREPLTKCINIFLACANGGHLADGARMLEEKCLKVAPDNWQILNNLGLYYRDQGGMQRDKALCDKSRKYYVKAADLVCEDPNASGNWKARVLNDAGVLFHFPMYMVRDMETGMKYYMKALTFDPEWVDANENMGICMNALGKYEEAIPYLEKALKQENDRRVSLRELRKAKRALNDK